MDLSRVFNRARINDRQVNELIGLARGITADGIVTQQEAEFLRDWLVANTAASSNPIVATLLDRVSIMLQDEMLDREESADLLETLQRFSGGKVETGEILKSTTLPLDYPAPSILIPKRRFCFTGTFAYGSRRDCEAAVTERGGLAGGLTQRTDYLVIGIYATDSWAHSSYGRKIERAAEMRQAGLPIAIIHEEHWLSTMQP